MVTDGRAASSAFWQMFETHMKDIEFKDVYMLGTWVRGLGVFPTADRVSLPVPAISEALS